MIISTLDKLPTIVGGLNIPGWYKLTIYIFKKEQNISIIIF